jgi:TetR/AcrR family transcriptional regulator
VNQSLADLVASYLAANHAHPDMARLLVWDEPTSHGGPRSPDAGEPGQAGDVPEVADIRRRQAAGEIAADLDPGFLLRSHGRGIGRHVP